MWSLLIVASSADIDSLTERAWEMGTSGIVEESGGLRIFFDDSQDKTLICETFELPQTAARDELPFDPVCAPVLDLDPLIIGNRFFVAPSWITNPTPAGRIRLTIDTTSAFGTGRHETTQLCLEALEEHMHPGCVLADIGCGSGILSLAASALGAGVVISCDIHENSVTTAHGLLPSPLFVGSADGLRTGFFDVVVANLTESVLTKVAYDLRRIAKPEGLIVVSGFLSENPPQHYKPWKKRAKGDWECWVCRPQEIDAEVGAGEPSAHRQQWWL